MEPTSQSDPGHDQVVSSVEAMSGALRALESALTQIREDDAEQRLRRRRIIRAITLLREAISELGSAEANDPHRPITGFVLSGSDRSSDAGDEGFSLLQRACCGERP